MSSFEVIPFDFRGHEEQRGQHRVIDLMGNVEGERLELRATKADGSPFGGTSADYQLYIVKGDYRASDQDLALLPVDTGISGVGTHEIFIRLDLGTDEVPKAFSLWLARRVTPEMPGYDPIDIRQRVWFYSNPVAVRKME